MKFKTSWNKRGTLSVIFWMLIFNPQAVAGFWVNMSEYDPCLKNRLPDYKKNYLDRTYRVGEQWLDREKRPRSDGEHLAATEKCLHGETRGDSCQFGYDCLISTKGGRISRVRVQESGICKRRG